LSTIPELTPLLDAIHASRRCLVTSHVDPEGDSLGSQLALACVLDELGKEVAVVDHDVPPAKYAFMPGVDRVVTPSAVQGRSFDTSFVVDCGSLERIGSVADLLPGTHVVNIDHHRSNTLFGDLNYVAPDACATGYLLYLINERLGLDLDLPRAINMYAAIITDTGNFQYSNTSSEVLRICANLIDVGLDPAQLSRCVFGHKPLEALKLLGEGLKSLRTVLDGRIGIIVLDRAAFERAGARDADAEGVVNFAKRVKGTDAGVLLRETPAGEIKISFRSDGAINVDAVAKQLGGGGHKNAAGARLQGPLDDAVERVLGGLNGALQPQT
jgi:phosphoesterase RecJ-like protein